MWACYSDSLTIGEREKEREREREVEGLTFCCLSFPLVCEGKYKEKKMRDTNVLAIGETLPILWKKVIKILVYIALLDIQI